MVNGLLEYLHEDNLTLYHKSKMDIKLFKLRIGNSIVEVYHFY